jgi:hypothetical protein
LNLKHPAKCEQGSNKCEVRGYNDLKRSANIVTVIFKERKGHIFDPR